MSALPDETTQPDPAPTSLPNNDDVGKESGDSSAPTNSAAEAVPDETNGSVVTKSEVKEEKSEDTNGSAATGIEVKEEQSAENGIATDSNNGDDPIQKPKLRTYEDGVLKTSAHQLEGENNSKYDPSVLPISNDAKQIRSQVEFYFGDTNLPTDKHMWEITGGAENLPVPIKEICKFGRMKRFQPQSAVVEALKASKFLVVLGDEGHEKVKRKSPFDPNVPKSAIEARSVYVKGFGDEEPSSQFDIEAFFATYGPTNAVRLRRTDDKLFKGSVFVEFQDEETAKKFLQLDPKPLWKGVHVLKVSSKTEYIETKAQEIRDGKIEPKAHRGSYGRGRGRGGNRGRGDYKDRGDRKREDRDPDDWKKRREEDRASGFKDNHRNDRKGGRGNNRDRGRGRRDDRGPRNNDRSNDRNKEREDKNKGSKAGGDDKDKEVKNDASEDKPVKSEAKVESPKNEKKRAREDDGEDIPAKKVDIKTEVTAAS